MQQNFFYGIGISYKTSNESIRGLFGITGEQRLELLQRYKDVGIESVFMLSTCNRTEIYVWTEDIDIDELIDIFISYLKADKTIFNQNAYIYKNEKAIRHLFLMGCSLDSQILGDFEIISQVKSSFNASKKLGLVNFFTERLFNSVIQASKRVRTETGISSGATSVSFATVQYILKNVDDVSNKNIVLFGTGKIGRNTCENLIKHINNEHITLINRTQSKAETIAGKFKLTVKPYEKLKSEITKTDILIVATGAAKPTITKEHITTSNKKLLIMDLSVPKNVDDKVKQLDNVNVLNLDYLSKITDKTLEQRKKYIPQAHEIIEQVMTDFLEWAKHRKYAPLIKALKNKLLAFKNAEIDFQSKKINDFQEEQADIITNRFIQKITTYVANYLKNIDNPSDKNIDFIKDVFELDTKTSK